MRRITIVVPVKNKKWKLSGIGTKNKTFASATSILTWIERTLRVRRFNEENVVRVKYGHLTNESVATKDPNDIIYTAGCFLEDYISKRTIRRLEKKYRGFQSQE